MEVRLTVTKVVFELQDMINNFGEPTRLTVTKVVFEFYSVSMYCCNVPINSNKGCF